MEAKQRLTIASTWVFEDVGVQEIRDRFKSETGAVGDFIEYVPGDEAFVIKANNVDKSISAFAQLMPDFIEEQRNKDLLDMPRVRRLEVSDVVEMEGLENYDNTPEKNSREMLVSLDDDSDDETVSAPSVRCTKYWLSSKGGLGCFASGFQDILAEVARLTGTEISIKDDVKGIQVSGNSSEDVDDALEKLAQIDKPLSLMARPSVENILQAPMDDGVRFRIANCSNSNDVALRRILADPTANSTSRLHQMFVTLLLNFDCDTQVYVLPETLKTPTPCSSEPGRSRIWQDFKFQELGNGDSYAILEADVEKEAAAKTESREVELESRESISDVTSEVSAAEHPYLTEEQVKHVGRWVSEGVKEGAVGVKVKPDEMGPPPKPAQETKLARDAPIMEPKKVAGIKTRRPLAAVQPLASPVQPTAPSIVKDASVLVTEPSPDVGDTMDSPDHGRKRWVMTFDASHIQTALNSAPGSTGIATNNGQEKVAGCSDNSSNSLIPETPEKLVYISGIKFPSNFDRNKYGSPGKTPPTPTPKAVKSGWASNQRFGTRNTSNSNTPTRSTRLIDVFSPSDNNVLPSAQRTLSFDQPALVPEPARAAVDTDPFTTTTVATATDQDETALSDYQTAPSESAYAGFTFESAPSGVESDAASERRILEIRHALGAGKEREYDHDASSTLSAPSMPHTVVNSMYKERLADLERSNKKEGKQTGEERATRQFHRTMVHRAPKPNAAASSKATMKAKRQATLEDAWGIPFRADKKSSMASSENKKTLGEKKQQSSEPESSKPDKEQVQKQVSQKKMEDSIRRLFDALQPTLAAAQFFPGTLTLEMQIGLVLIPLLPKTYKGDLISMDEWNKIFKPRKGMFAPSTKFIKRLTSSGVDVDHIVDLKTSKAEGKLRLFEQRYTDYGLVYEYHCRTKNDELIILVIDEAGNITVRKKAAALGAVNLHFPGHTWDASAVVTGFTEQVHGSDKELDKAIRHITDNLWVPPDRSLVRIFTRLPEGNELSVDKVFMKRWTRHRYLLSEQDPNPCEPASRKTSNLVKQKKQTSQDDTDTLNPTNSNRQDIFLKVTEVQDLWTGVSPTDKYALRARCGPLDEMIQKGRLWYEVSIISPTVEDVLQSNTSLEVGECTQDWCPIDLMGNEAHLVLPKSSSKERAQTPSPIAAAIGAAGIGEMLRVASTVVEKIDSIGYWNVGPGIEVARNAAGFEAIFAANSFAPGVGTGAPTMAVVKTERKGKSFEDLESVMEMESASMMGDPEVMDFW